MKQPEGSKAATFKVTDADGDVRKDIYTATDIQKVDADRIQRSPITIAPRSAPRADHGLGSARQSVSGRARRGGVHAWRASDEQCPGFRAEGQRMGTFWASVIADKNKDSYSYPVEKTIL